MILKQVEKYCRELLLNSKCNYLPFHNLTHTVEVVRNVKLIAKELEIPKEEADPIIIAAWFHDIGLSKIYDGHEDISRQLAKDYLVKEEYNEAKIKTVLSCINATKMPQQPNSLYEEILCDADVFHIGTSNFFYKKILLRREWELENNKIFSDFEWHELNLDFLHNFHFHTKYGKDVLEEEKLINENRIKNILKFYN